MADEEKNNAAPAEAPAKSGLPIKTIIIVVAVMIIEGAAFAIVHFISGGPAKVEATVLEEDALAETLEPVELAVIADKFQNTRRGIAYTYDTEVYITVQQRYAEQIGGRIESMQNAIRDDVSRIFRQAEPSHLMETELLTIRRQIGDALNDRFDLDEEGNPYVLEVLLPKCQQFRSDL